MSDEFNPSRSFAGKSVLVTGSSGFIGAHLCRRLVAGGARVHAISRQQRENSHLEWWQADLGDIAELRRIFQSAHPDIIFHLASRVAGARDLGMVLPTFTDNLASTVHLLTVVAENGCERFVLASSSEEPIGSGKDAFPCSPYAAAKWASSMYGRMFTELYHLPVVMPRIFMTYGPDQKDLQKLVPFVVLCLLRGEVPAISSGVRRADWIYVDDVVEGLLRAAVTPGIEGCAFDLGSGVLTSVREIVEQIVEIVGPCIQPAFGTLPDRPFEQERPADTAFLISRLGYRPGTRLRQGLEATAAWYREHHRHPDAPAMDQPALTAATQLHSRNPR
jgi:nucleoside-diphosphate-sugar epimerase